MPESPRSRPPVPTASALLPFHGQFLRSLRGKLLKWFQQHGRELPWRTPPGADPDVPYRVWISEIMLQQTTVVAVRPYYERFLARFPTLATLAEAPLDDVLRLWEGLGYYSRARNLHRAAQAVVDRFEGQLPQNLDDLQSLPGIGRYTAGALRSFGYGLKAPIVEANTLRLYSRLLGFEGDPKQSTGQQLVWQLAETLVPDRSPGVFNLALMDLGALVCSPAEPRCPECPLQEHCTAFRSGRQDVIPRMVARPEVTPVTAVVVAVRQRGRYLLRQYGPGERWVGLWDFLRFDLSDPHSPQPSPDQVQSHVHHRFGVTCERATHVLTFKHAVTRYRITVHAYLAEAGRPGPLITAAVGNSRWSAPADFASTAFSRPGRRVADALAALATDPLD